MYIGQEAFDEGGLIDAFRCCHVSVVEKTGAKIGKKYPSVLGPLEYAQCITFDEGAQCLQHHGQCQYGKFI